MEGIRGAPGRELLQAPGRLDPGRVVLALALGLGLILRLHIVFFDQGVFYPDEFFQTLEPAHALVFGYGLLPWEFLQGGRSWTVPGIVAGLFELCRALDQENPWVYLLVVRLFFVAIQVVGAWGLYRLARLFAGPFPAAAATAAFYVSAPAVYFAHRAMSENVSMVLVVWSMVFLLAPTPDRRRRIAGASLLGASLILRPQNLPIVLMPLIRFGFRRDRRELIEIVATLAFWAGVCGLIDRLTWGRWYQSLIGYYRAAFQFGLAGKISTSPWYYYFAVTWSSLGGLGVLVFAFGCVAARRARELWLGSAICLAFFSAVAHKEIRFMIPFAPLFFGLAAAGIEEAGRVLPPVWRRGLPIVLLCFALASALTSRRLTFGDLGHSHFKAHDSAYDFFGPANRLFIAAGALPDLCGLAVPDFPLEVLGAYSHLHRRVPIYGGEVPPPGNGFYSHEIVLRPPAGATIVAVESPFFLVRISDAGCTPDPGYRFELPLTRL